MPIPAATDLADTDLTDKDLTDKDLTDKDLAAPLWDWQELAGMIRSRSS